MSATSPLASHIEVPAMRTALTKGSIARALVHGMVAGMPVTLRYPDGTAVGAGAAAAGDPVIDILDPVALYRRLEHHPKIGLGEAYMAGEWRAAPGTDLAEAMAPFAARLGGLLPRPLLALRGLLDRRMPVAHRNTPTGARRNIAAHYDLSNALFETFLDPSMTYSSALFEGVEPWTGQSLEAAQHRKIDAILDAAEVGPGSRVLEIGTGWGELALRAAGRGAVVTTITLSSEQRAYAVAKLAAAGVSDRVEVRLQDYREVVGEYDSVVSVEMLEAVGHEYWPTYFATIERVLAPTGTAAIQTILMDHHRYLATRNSFGWIQKYIFPGGLIPSLPAIRHTTTAHTSLRVTSERCFGAHYAETLRRWRDRFTEAGGAVAALGFDDVFRRMWEFYLAYSEAGFRAGYLDVAQLTVRRTL